MNKKVLVIVIGIILVLGGLVIYFEKSQKVEAEVKDSSNSIEITHELGTINIDKVPERVVVLDYGALDVLDALNVPISGVSKSNTMPDYLSKYAGDEYKSCGSIKEPDLEAINEIKPDLIIMSGRMADYYEELSKIARTLYVSVEGSDYMNTFKSTLETYGKIFDKEKQAQELYSNAVKKLSNLQEKTSDIDAKASFVMINGKSLSTYGKNSRFGFLFNEMGFKEIDTSIEASTHGSEINFEYLVNKDPEYIFVINRNTIVGNAEENTTSDMMENELIKKTTAYKNNRIIYLNTIYWYTISGGYTSTMSMIEEVEKVFYLQEKK